MCDIFFIITKNHQTNEMKGKKSHNQKSVQYTNNKFRNFEKSSSSFSNVDDNDKIIEWMNEWGK